MPDPIGRACLMEDLDYKCITVIDCTIVKLDPQKVDPSFVVFFLNSQPALNRAKVLATSTTRQRISRKQLEGVPLILPSLPEQKRIADILTTVDDAIEKTTQIIEKTKELKKGMMQRLLTSGIGHKKFKKTEIGEIPTSWEVVKLRDIVKKFYNGGTPDTTNKEYWDGHIPWVTGADFENQKVNRIRKYISYEGVENSATNVIPEGNLLVVTRMGVGKLAIAPFDIAISQDITGVISNPRRTFAGFLYWYLDHKSNRLTSIVQGTSINVLLRGDLESFVIPLPPIKEQKKIAKILSSINDEIEKESKHRDQLILLKRGLMHLLLTGKLRVTVQ
jgi:type I restriction enzyme S subunit